MSFNVIEWMTPSPSSLPSSEGSWIDASSCRRTPSGAPVAPEENETGDYALYTQGDSRYEE